MSAMSQSEVSITLTESYYKQLFYNAMIVDELRKALDSDIKAYDFITIADKLLNGERQKYDIRGYGKDGRLGKTIQTNA